jgi:hypothetical protein
LGEALMPMSPDEEGVKVRRVVRKRQRISG